MQSVAHSPFTEMRSDLKKERPNASEKLCEVTGLQSVDRRLQVCFSMNLGKKQLSSR